MARPMKRGVDYFPHDVDLSTDEKVQFLELEHGLLGYAVYMKILEKIYRSGYCLEFGEKDKKLFALNNRIDLSAVEAITVTLLEEGLFSREVYDRAGVLTSAGIQRRYIGACKRRDAVTLNRKHIVSATLSEINAHDNVIIVDDNGVTVSINEVNDDNSTQSKVKESKGKESIFSGNFSDQDIELCTELRKSIESINPDYFKNGVKKALEKWPNEFRLIREVDKRDVADIRTVIQLFPKNDFWSTNIRSPKALRGELKDGRDKFQAILDEVSAKRGNGKSNEITIPQYPEL